MLKHQFIKQDFLPGINCDLQLQLGEGEPLVIYGENGVGKSTFLRLFFEEQQIHETRVLISQKITPHFFDRKIKVLKNIIKSLPEINLNRFDHLWMEFNFQYKEDLYLSQLSGGERQIFHIISLLSRESKIYLMDEPSVGLDDNNKNILLKMIEEVARNRFIIIVEHEKSWIPSSWPQKQIVNDRGVVRFSS